MPLRTSVPWTSANGTSTSWMLPILAAASSVSKLTLALAQDFEIYYCHSGIVFWGLCCVGVIGGL